MTGEVHWLMLQTQSANFGFQATKNIEDCENGAT